MSVYFDLFFTADSVLFKAIWRVLRREGWSSKPPPLRSLDSSFRYVKPGCNPDSVEDTDYFRGEEALVAYYRKQSVQLIQTDGNTVRLLPFRELPANSQERLARNGGYEQELECHQNGASEGNDVGHRDRGEPPSPCDSNIAGSTDSGERSGPLNNAEIAEVGTADVDNTGTCAKLAHVDTSERAGPTSDDEGPEVGPARTSDTNIVEIAGWGDTIQPNPCSGGHAEQMGCHNRGGHDAPDGHAARGGHGSSRDHDGRGCDGTGGRGIRGGRGDRGILSQDLDAEESCDRNSVDDAQRGIGLISEPASSVAVVDLVTPPSLPQRHEVCVNCLIAFTRHKHTQSVNIGILQRGIENYRILTRSTSRPTWSALTATSDGKDSPPDVVLDDLVEVDRYIEFVSEQAIPTSLRKVETIKK
ncbi:unnamed protein product [Phytophthora fragariaefolia]|uniref:Unnamed protein product n=1 Tax=Phytophthora fragariaefolia TaxID=1490495 RepID=A0A9W6TVK5_9STRA|nr:unnamed protein product [Phytophthora fragariaefolia]